jgi:hypothetical protein
MVLPCNRLGANLGRVRCAYCCRTPPRPTWSAASRPAAAVIVAISLEGNGPLRCARLHHEPAWRRSHQERSARPPAACSSYYPGYSLRNPSSPTRLANIAVCFAFFPKLWGPLFRSETLHDRRDSHRGHLAPARRPPGADPKRLRAANGLGVAAKPLYPAVPSSCGLCAAPLDYSLAQEFLIFATARDVSGERSPNVIGRALSCSSAGEPRRGAGAACSSRHRRGASTLAPQCPRKCGELTQYGGIGRGKSRRKTS